jgi:drug/metabolite transporter (DMT)-like permease
VPELSIAVLIVGGTGLYINLLFYTTGGAFGTGSRPILLALLLVVSFRAIYEYLRTPPAERPRVFTWLTVLLAMFWVYYMAHVLYINLFRYNTPSPDHPKKRVRLFAEVSNSVL